MDEAGDNTIIFDARVTTLFNNHDRQTEFKPAGLSDVPIMSNKLNKVIQSKLEQEQFVWN
jgi:hypothetical protein